MGEGHKTLGGAWTVALVWGTDKVKIRRLAVVFFERMKEDTCSIVMAQAG